MGKKGKAKRKARRETSHQTTVMEIDMGRPHARSMVLTEYDRKENSKENKSLSLRTTKNLQVTLKSCNPFKYTYAIDATPISLFGGRSPFDTIQNNLSKIQGEVATAQNATPAKPDSVTAAMREANVIKMQKENEVLASVQKKTKLATAKKVLKQNNITGVDTASIETIKLSVADKIQQNTKKIVDTQAAIQVSYSNDTSYAQTVHKTYGLILEARSLLENVKLFESSIKPEDFLDQGAYEDSLKNFGIRFDDIIEKYRACYEEINRDDTTNTSQGAIKKLEKLRTWYKDILSNLNAARNYLAGMQLYNYTVPIDVNGSNIDAVQVNVRRTSIKQPSLTENYTYKVWIKGGIKIDVSAGVFLTSLTDKQYQVKDVDTNVNYKTIQRKNTGDLNLGFGSTMNFSLRTGAAWVKPSLNFGVLFTTNTTQKFQFLTSFGLILGKEQRGILHFGAAFGTVTTIQKGYADDGTAAYKLGATGTVPTVEKFDIGYFFGFTYNLTQPKVQKDAGQDNM